MHRFFTSFLGNPIIFWKFPDITTITYSLQEIRYATYKLLYYYRIP